MVTARYLYIHGFNSSPDSHKAREFVSWCQTHRPHAEVIVPELSHDPRLALGQLETIAEEGPLNLILGSSLGGYYATWLSEKYNAPAVLINPAVSPWQHMQREFLGWHTNYYSGRQYEVTAEHVAALKPVDLPALRHPDNFLLLVQTGDEVLDYQLALEKYRECEQIVQPGGNHSFTGFTAMLPTIMARANA